MSDFGWRAYYRCGGCNLQYRAITLVHNSPKYCNRCGKLNTPYQQVTNIEADNIFQVFDFLRVLLSLSTVVLQEWLFGPIHVSFGASFNLQLSQRIHKIRLFKSNMQNLVILFILRNENLIE